MSDRADISRTGRTCRTASSWVRRAVALVPSCAEHENEHVRRYAGYEAATLLELVLDDLEELVAFIPDDDDFDFPFEQAKRAADELGRKIRDRHLAAKLSNVEGRTPEEAAAFRAKAEELAKELAGR